MSDAVLEALIAEVRALRERVATLEHSEPNLSWLRLGGLTTGRLEMRTFTLANNAGGLFPNVSGDGAGTTGLAIVTDTTGAVGLFSISGVAHVTGEISDSGGVFSATFGTASSTNIYWSGANNRYEVENKRGATVTYYILMFVNG